MKKYFYGFVMLGVLFVLSACNRIGTGGTAGGGDTIKLGLITPLTGDIASAGEMMRNNIDDFLAVNPTWAGKKVELFVEDGKCNPQEGASAAQKLVNATKVDIVLSMECSGATLGALPIAEQAKKLVVSAFSTSPKLSGASKYFYRVSPSDNNAGRVMAEVLLKDGLDTVALITENTDFATAYAEVFKREYKGKIVVEENYNSGVNDFKTTLQKIKKSKAKAIVHMNQTPAVIGFLAKQTKELGLKYPIYGTDASDGKEFWDIAKNAAEGVVHINAAADKNRPEVKAKIDEYKKKHGKDPTFEAYFILSWDLFGILKQAVEKVGVDGDKLSDYLKTMPDYPGIAGPIRFNDKGDSNVAQLVLVAKGGKWEVKK
jgi:branched-chain amino acid transport system substrate-binding protein